MKISKKKRLGYFFKDLTIYIVPFGVLYYGFFPVVVSNVIFTLLFNCSFWQTTLWTYGSIAALVYGIMLLNTVFAANSPYDKEHEEKLKEQQRKQKKIEEKERIHLAKQEKEAFKQKMESVLKLKQYLEKLNSYERMEQDIIWKTKEINEVCIMHLETKKLEAEQTHYLSTFVPSKLFKLLETFDELEGEYREAERENVMQVLEQFQKQIEQKFEHEAQQDVQLELRKQMRVLQENKY